MNRLLRRIPPLDSFRAVVALGLLVGGLGLAAALVLCLKIVIPLASECLQACSGNPTLMAVARGSASLFVAVMASGLVAGSWVLMGQWRTTRQLVKQVESSQTTPPRRLLQTAAKLGLGQRLTYVSDPAAYAFCYGFRSPRICLSSGMARKLSQRELKAVLLHEVHHLRQRDPLRVLASRVVAGALFLLPLAADLRDRYLVEKELDADTHVVARMSPEPLAGALLKLCRGDTQPAVGALAAAAVGPFNAVGERIRHLARPSQRLAPLRPARIAASVAVVVLVLLASVGSTFAADRTLPAGGSCCATGDCSAPVGDNHVTSR